EALQQDDWCPNPVDGMNRRARSVDISVFRPAADQALVVHRLELVGVVVKRLEVTDPKMAGAGFEEVAARHRPQYGVATGTAAGDRDAVTVNQAAVDQITGALDGVVHVDDAPLSVEALTILASVTGAAAVVDHQVAEAARGPELVTEIEGVGDRPRRTTVDVDDQWRQLADRRLVGRIERR